MSQLHFPLSSPDSGNDLINYRASLTGDVVYTRAEVLMPPVLIETELMDI